MLTTVMSEIVLEHVRRRWFTKAGDRASRLIGMGVALAFALIQCGTAHAQGYPQKPIRLVIPLAPGGGNDTLGRYMAKQMTEGLGQQIIVENRPGGGGLVGGEFAARAAPDGYTLVFSGSGLLVVTLTYSKLDMRKDFTPIALVGEYASLLVVHPSLPVKSVADLISLAKARPGQLNYGSAGTGSAGHLVMEMFRSRAAIDMVHVPYKGAGPALTEVMAGQVSVLFSNPLGSFGFVKAGRLRPLAVSGPRRIAALPDVPTVAESGLPGFSSTFFLGLMGPAGLPRDIVSRLNGEVLKALQRREVQDWLAAQGMDPLGGSAEDFAARIRTDIEAMAKVIRDAGVRLN
ncbi:MAG: Bug family tripartite tricarboxylate transporter substrate binding protein [Burkholderiales bacterium]